MAKRRNLPPDLARALAVGPLAGLAVLVADALLAWLTLGYPVPVRPTWVAWYLAAGAVAALAAAAGVRLFRRRVAGAAELAAATAALLYAPAVAERLFHLLSYRLAATAAIAGTAVAVAGYGVWLVLMRRAGGTVPGLLCAALAVAVGLALNRNVIALPTEPMALTVDALVVLAAVALAIAARRAGGRKVAVALGLAAVAAVALRAVSSGPRAVDPVVPAAAAAPNLLLVIVDTLRDDVFRAVVDETEEGRSFRRALGPAVWFDDAVAAAPWTPPSVASILTGLYPQEHGFDRRQGADSSRPLHRLAESVTTLAEHLRDRGYRTSAITTNPFLHPEAGIAQGFASFEALQDGTAKLPLLTVLRRLGVLDTELYQGAERVRSRLGKQLDSLARGDRPFFLWLHLMDPHLPLRRHRDLSPDPAAELPEIERLYRDEVRHAARELARVFELLERRGLWHDTAVVLVSDHGEMMLSDRRFRRVQQRGFRRTGHGHALYRELVRVPLVIRPPGGLAADREVGVLASHVDLVPTVTDLLGVERLPLPAGRVSLAPWLGTEAGSAPVRSWALIGATQEPVDQRGLRTERFKLIEYLGGERPPELYRLDRDPGERRNLAAHSPRVAARLRELLEERWGSLLPPPEAEALAIDEEERRRLEALGYL